MRVLDLPLSLQKLVRDEYRRLGNGELTVNENTVLISCFIFLDSIQGHKFWKDIDNGIIPTKYLNQCITYEEILKSYNDEVDIDLSKLWCVKNDGSQRFKDLVLPILNKLDSLQYTGLNSMLNRYYGIDPLGNRCIRQTSNDFNNNVLTLDTIERLTSKPEPMVTVRNQFYEGEYVVLLDKPESVMFKQFYIYKVAKTSSVLNVKAETK